MADKRTKEEILEDIKITEQERDIYEIICRHRDDERYKPVLEKVKNRIIDLEKELGQVIDSATESEDDKA